MAYGKAGRPRTTGYISQHQAAQRLGVSYYALRQGIANGTAFDEDDLFRISDSRVLIAASAVERKTRGGGKA